MQATVKQFPVLNDNYMYLIEAGDNLVGIVDPPEADFFAQWCAERGERPRVQILNTHHHTDHTGGNLALKSQFDATVTGPRADRARIPGIDTAVGEGETLMLGHLVVEVIDVPGHTRGHIAYYISALQALFCGDTLFSLGCGRLFEGTPAQMFASLQKFKALPPETLVYCAHEYTEANLRFALSVDFENAALKKRGAEVEALRAKGLPTVPSTIASELACNPFMRARDVAELARLRAKKDSF